MRAKVVRFQVRGTFRFPIDMLRYDACWPESESKDSWAITTSYCPGSNPGVEGWTVTLRSADEAVCRRGPTVGRWASFGWHVVDGSLEKVQ